MRIKEQRDLGQCNTILYIVARVMQQICRMRRQDGGVAWSRADSRGERMRLRREIARYGSCSNVWKTYGLRSLWLEL